MDIIAMVAIVVAATQVIKQIFTKIDPNIIAVAVSILVVVYKTIETGTPWTFALIVTLVQVIIGAVGSFKVAKQVLSPTA
jgi:hypothetical protein